MGTEAPRLVSGAFNPASRTVTYASASGTSRKLIQTNIGNSFINNAPIPCLFERNNMVMQTEKGPVPFSSKIYVHRLLPEVAGTGSINITVGGANSTGQPAVYSQTGVAEINTNTPWITTQQNAVRTVSVKVESNDATNAWNLTAINWQTTIVEDAF
jgi:hypothetical protein